VKDYYSILGVSRNATEEEIKQAFRRQAMKHHPDRGGDSVLFQDINEAYSVLSDDNKRAEYDQQRRYGHAFNASSFDFKSHFGGGNIHDIFENLFRGDGNFSFGHAISPECFIVFWP
jgi:DnaJ-class molecular chaperone